MVGSISKIGQFFEHLNFEKYEPGSLYVGPFSAKIFLKIWFCKIDPLLPPHIDFNTIPYFTYGCPYRGVKEGKLKKKQVIAIGKKTACAVELHPVEVTYNTPSTLLFCRYDNALRTLPDPLGRLHLKCSRRGAVLFVQHHLIDSVVGRSLGRLGVFQLVLSTGSHAVSSSLEQCGRSTECTNDNTLITLGTSAPPANRLDATVLSKITRGFPQHTTFFS